MGMKHNKFRRVGVLGVEATIVFMQRIHDLTDATDDQDNVPLIVDMNPQVPSRIKCLIEGTGEDPGPVICEMAKRLETAGADVLAMPCNTAHHYAKAIEKSVGIHLLNMTRLTCERVAGLKPPVITVGILASPATNQIGIFQRELIRLSMRALYPDDEAEVLECIRRIKHRGASKDDVDEKH